MLPRYYNDESYSAGRRRWIYNSVRGIATTPKYLAQVAAPFVGGYGMHRYFKSVKRSRVRGGAKVRARSGGPRVARKYKPFRKYGRGPVKRRKRMYKYSGKRRANSVKTLSKRVNYIEKQTLSCIKFRAITNRLDCSHTENHCKYHSYPLLDTIDLNTFLTNVPMYVWDAASSEQQLRLTDLTEQKDMDYSFEFKPIIIHNYQRNTGSFPVKLAVYIIKPRIRNGTPASNQLTTQLAHVQGPSGTLDMQDLPPIYPSDLKGWLKFWRIEKVYNKVLMPGETFKSTVTVDSVVLDPNAYNDITDKYQPNLKSVACLVRTQGVVTQEFDSNTFARAASTLVTTNGQVACWTEVVAEVRYDAGGPAFVNYRQFNDFTDTQGHQPMNIVKDTYPQMQDNNANRVS